MATLNVTIDDETLRLAEVRAAELGTTVNEMVCDDLDRLVWGEDRAPAALRRIVAHARGISGGAEASGYKWNRDEIYEDRLGRWM